MLIRLQYLKQFYKTNPYPTLEQKKQIQQATELEVVQVSSYNSILKYVLGNFLSLK